MAKYIITHSCGHTATHGIFGTNSHGERDRKQAWLASSLCTDCYRAQQAAEAAKKSACLPELTGSPKQIAWAMQIRIGKLAEIDTAYQAACAKTAQAEGDLKIKLLAQKSDIDTKIAALKVQTSASYWIDNRDTYWSNLVASQTPVTQPAAQKTAKTVMTRAWEIARTAVAKFGGKIKEYLSGALKMAWSE